MDWWEGGVFYVVFCGMSIVVCCLCVFFCWNCIFVYRWILIWLCNFINCLWLKNICRLNIKKEKLFSMLFVRGNRYEWIKFLVYINVLS